MSLIALCLLLPLCVLPNGSGLTNSQMPYMSGVEVVRALREANIPLYVVGCTGNALREDQVYYPSTYFRQEKILMMAGRILLSWSGWDHT